MPVLFLLGFRLCRVSWLRVYKSNPHLNCSIRIMPIHREYAAIKTPRDHNSSTRIKKASCETCCIILWCGQGGPQRGVAMRYIICICLTWLLFDESVVAQESVEAAPDAELVKRVASGNPQRRLKTSSQLRTWRTAMTRSFSVF